MIYKFSTPTCCMCKMVGKALTAKGIEFTEVDCTTDEGMALAERYNIQGVPAVIHTDKDGNVLHRFSNYRDIVSNTDKLK